MTSAIDNARVANQNAIRWWRTDFDEVDLRHLVETVKNEHISMGPVTEKFEHEIAKQLNVPYVVAVASGSVALLMAMIAHDIGPGDEVIVPNRTWIAVAHAAKMLGAKTVLVDVLPDIPNIDTSKIEEKISSRTKAIVPTPLNGRAVDMPVIDALAKKYNLRVIEDAAQGLFCGQHGSYMGTIGDIGCFSLSVAKLIPSGQGGFIVTRDKAIYEKLLRIRTHGVSDMIHCTFAEFGFNFRITDLQASLAYTQLMKVKERIASLNKVYQLYEAGLTNVDAVRLIPVSIDSGEIPLYTEVLCERREALVSFLAEHNVQVRPFYPNINTASYLDCAGKYPHSEIYSSQGLVLPCGPGQSQENIEKTLSLLTRFQ